MKRLLVGVIDYGAGNTGSVISALDYLGVDAKVVRDADELGDLDKLVLPGVGSYRNSMNNLNRYGFTQRLRDEVLINKKPMLGICLGFQLLFTCSTEEGLTQGLGLLKGKVIHLKDFIDSEVKFPHIGFNQIEIHSSHQFFRGIESGSDFYFVHSYGLDIRENGVSSFCSTEYGRYFVSGVAHGNIMGTQFHPEKSQSNGLLLLKNFLEYEIA